MQIEAHFDGETIERLEEQSGLLLKMYEADFAKDPTSPATASSRSNMIALRHSINQIYGKAAALEVANSLGSVTDAIPTDEGWFAIQNCDPRWSRPEHVHQGCVTK